MINNRTILAFLFVLLTFISINQWLEIPIGNTYSTWIVCFIIIVQLFIVQKKYPVYLDQSETRWIRVYLIWVLICALRGLFVGENYWDYKNLVSSTLGLLVVLSYKSFTNPDIVSTVLRNWIRFAMPLFAVFIFFMSSDAYGFYMAPISLVVLFTPILPRPWKFIIPAIAIIVVLADIDARSTAVKLVVPLLFSMLVFFPKFLNGRFTKISFRGMFIIPPVLLILAVTNVFNIFQMDQYISGQYTKMKVVNGQMREVNLISDSRTFLYTEVVVSAVKNEYVILGRTMARGNDSQSFGVEINEELKTGRDERYFNEVSVMNIFTWTGLIGLLLYGLIFFRAAWLAIYKSSNQFMKVLGLYVSFRWCTAWVEDFNRFDIMNITLWIVLAMCYSQKFRMMKNHEFIDYIKTFFSKPTKAIRVV